MVYLDHVSDILKVLYFVLQRDCQLHSRREEEVVEV